MRSLLFFLGAAALGLSLVSVASIASAALIIEGVKVEPYAFDVTTVVQIEPVLAEDSPTVSLEYRWFINGDEVLHEISDFFPGNLLRRGDQLSVEVTAIAFGGERLETFVSSPLETGNSSPEITSEPPAAISERGFQYQVSATDPDGDSLIYSLAEAPEGMTIDPVSGKVEWPFEVMPQGVFTVRIVVEDGFGGRADQFFDLNLSLTAKENDK